MTVSAGPKSSKTLNSNNFEYTTLHIASKFLIKPKSMLYVHENILQYIRCIYL